MAQTPVKNPLRGVGSEFGREGFEVGAGDGGAVEMREFFGVGDRFNLFTQALRNSLKADFQRLEDGLLLGRNQTFLATFLTTFLATFLTELFGE